MTLDTIIQIAISSNKNYAQALNKEITFSHEIADKTNTYHVYMTLSIINNLVTNAIEAIDKKGTIHINIINSNKKLIIEISDRKSTRLNSSHVASSYAVFCLKKKTDKQNDYTMIQ